MAIIIGTDEAGYGPNLGPLLIAATVWRVPDEQLDGDLYQLLAPVVGASVKDDSRLVIADSKELYKPQGSLERLEQGLLAAIKAKHVWESAPSSSVPSNWREVWDGLAPQT